MGMKKIAITLDEEALNVLDSLVSDEIYPNRSKAIQAAVEDKLADMQRTRLYMESMKINITEEQAIAEGLGRND